MVSQEIEKEIQQENKIIAGMNLRQIVCVGIGFVICVIITFFYSDMDIWIDIAMAPCAVVGIIAWAFGWMNRDGIPFEKLLLKWIQSFIYKTNTRQYRTKNRYITLMNKEYNHRKKVDMNDKAIAKEIKKEQKQKSKVTTKGIL